MANPPLPGPSRHTPPTLSPNGIRVLILVILAVLALTGLAWSNPGAGRPADRAMTVQKFQEATSAPTPANSPRVFFGLFSPGDNEDTTGIIIGSSLLVFIILGGTLAALRPRKNKS
jgi:hypothetical protein